MYVCVCEVESPTRSQAERLQSAAFQKIKQPQRPWHVEDAAKWNQDAILKNLLNTLLQSEEAGNISMDQMSGITNKVSSTKSQGYFNNRFHKVCQNFS